MTPSIPNLRKYIAPQSQEQAAILTRLSQLQFHTFNEADVREEFLVPLIELLGYARNSDYAVLREESYALNPLFLTVGSKRIKLDYRFNTYKAGFWLLEAKAGACADPTQPPEITSEMIGQAHFYAHHREVDCPLFGVSNGWWTHIYDRDAEDPRIPILSIFYADLPSKFHDLYELIGATQVTFWIKRRLLTRIEQTLSADVDLARSDEFLRAARTAAARAYPKVLENFRRNAAIRREVENEEFRDYLETSRPHETLDTLLMWPLNWGAMNVASDILARRLAQSRGSNQLLFFHKLLVKEPRAVTIDYYFNALNLLGTLCQVPNLRQVDARGTGTSSDTPIISLYVEFANLLLSYFSSRPDLQVMWAMEGLLKRMAKRAIVSNRTARLEIAAGVEMQRYFQPEEVIAYLGPSPARTVVQAVESVTLAELGAFFHRHANKQRNQEFDARSALDEFQSKRAAFEPMEDATDAAYRALTKALGSEWSELTWSDNLNRTWDRLGHGVCEILLSRRELLQQLPDESRARIVEIARLGNSFAKQCVEALGMTVPAPYPDAPARLRRIFALADS